MIVNRNPPLNLCDEDRWIFDSWSSYDFPPLKVLVINDAFYNNDGHVWTSNGEEMVKESLIAPEWNTPGPLTLVQRRMSIKTNSASIIWNCNWNHNYYHYWCDSVPRLLQMLNNKDLEVIVSTYDSIPQREWVLDILGFKNLKKVSSNTIYHSPKLFLPTYNKISNSQQNPLLVSKLREIFLPHQSNLDLGPRIYIKRDDRLDSVSMRILDTVCERYGFVQVRLEQYSYSDQISIFNKANIIIGIHGAGLTNIQWCKENTNLIEIRNRKDDQTPYYYNLASTINMRYWYIMGDILDKKSIDFNTARSIMTIQEKDIVDILERVQEKDIVETSFIEEENVIETSITEENILIPKKKKNNKRVPIDLDI